MSKVSCQQCEGRGVVTTHGPKVIGRASNGEPVYSAIHTAVPQNRFCESCRGIGTVEAAPAVSPTSGGHLSGTASAVSTDPCGQVSTSDAVTFGGHAVDAPNFTQAQFERAMCRALADELEVRRDQTGQYLVCHRNGNGGYAATRSSCTCKAGQVGTPCKHRAALIFHLDVREPSLRRQWADAQKAVAA